MPFGTDSGGAFKETPALCVTYEMGEAGGEALAVMGLSPERPAAVCSLSPLPNFATSAPPTPPRTRCQLCTPLSMLLPSHMPQSSVRKPHLSVPYRIALSNMYVKVKAVSNAHGLLPFIRLAFTRIPLEPR